MSLGFLPGLSQDRAGRPVVAPGGLAPTPGQVNLKTILRFHHLDPAVREALAPNAPQSGPGGCQRRIRGETPLGDQKPTKNRVFHDVFGVAPSGIPWESPGSPNDRPRALKRHQNDTKTMQWHQNDTKTITLQLSSLRDWLSH